MKFDTVPKILLPWQRDATTSPLYRSKHWTTFFSEKNEINVYFLADFHGERTIEILHKVH